MPTAAVCLRASPHYSREAFMRGIETLGYRAQLDPSANPNPDDVIITWNRHGAWNTRAQAYAERGAKVIVCENGYVGVDGNGHQYYAIARDQHNGAGTWHVGDEDRWSRLGIELKPWRSSGRHILIMPSRSIGSPTIAMPRDWTERTVEELKKHTDRPIRIRPHPGKDRALWPIEPDLVDCWAVVVWASSGGIKSLIAGVPCFHGLKDWIGKQAALTDLSSIESPTMWGRPEMLHRLAWAQWTLAEITEGEPFRWLLG